MHPPGPCLGHRAGWSIHRVFRLKVWLNFHGILFYLTSESNDLNMTFIQTKLVAIEDHKNTLFFRNHPSILRNIYCFCWNKSFFLLTKQQIQNSSDYKEFSSLWSEYYLNLYHSVCYWKKSNTVFTTLKLPGLPSDNLIKLTADKSLLSAALSPEASPWTCKLL